MIKAIRKLLSYNTILHTPLSMLAHPADSVFSNFPAKPTLIYLIEIFIYTMRVATPSMPLKNAYVYNNSFSFIPNTFSPSLSLFLSIYIVFFFSSLPVDLRHSIANQPEHQRRRL